MGTKIINLFAGPGSGKSTNMAFIFGLLKKAGVNGEMATEFAKDKVWEESFGVFKSQPYVFGKQFHKVNRLVDKTEAVVTDSPILLSVTYDNTSLQHFTPVVVEAFRSFDNMNYFIRRTKKYNPNGRMQTEDEAKVIDMQIYDMLHNYNIPFTIVEDNAAGVEEIVNDVLCELGSTKRINFSYSVYDITEGSGK